MLYMLFREQCTVLIYILKFEFIYNIWIINNNTLKYTGTDFYS